MKTETLELILHDAFSIAFNMNDTFYYACADSSCIDMEDLKDLEPVIEKYGNNALIAYEALKRGHDPLKPLVTEEFKNAKNEIEQLLKKQLMNIHFTNLDQL